MEITIKTQTIKCKTGTTAQLAEDLLARRLFFAEAYNNQSMKTLSLSNSVGSLPIAHWSDAGQGFPGRYEPTNWDSTYQHVYTPAAVQAIKDYAAEWCDHQNAERENDTLLTIHYDPTKKEL